MTPIDKKPAHFTPYPVANIMPPEAQTNRLASFAGSMLNFAQSGFAVADPDTIAKRQKICNGCNLWDSAAMGGTGKCKKCGCSTWAKLRIALEKCPLDKW